jgi:hypothetical protein
MMSTEENLELSVIFVFLYTDATWLALVRLSTQQTITQLFIVDYCLVFSPFSFGHWISCHFSNELMLLITTFGIFKPYLRYWNFHCCALTFKIVSYVTDCATLHHNIHLRFIHQSLSVWIHLHCSIFFLAKMFGPKDLINRFIYLFF